MVYAATGVPSVVPTWTACKILWWRRHEPEVFARARRFLLVEDLILHRLTGRFVTEGGIACTSLLYDIVERRWWEPMLEFVGVGAEPVSYTHLRAHETRHDLVCRLLLEKKKTDRKTTKKKPERMTTR